MHPNLSWASNVQRFLTSCVNMYTTNQKVFALPSPKAQDCQSNVIWWGFQNRINSQYMIVNAFWCDAFCYAFCSLE